MRLRDVPQRELAAAVFGVWRRRCAPPTDRPLGGRFATRVFSSETAACVLALRARARKPPRSIVAFPPPRSRRRAPRATEASDRSCRLPLRRARCQTQNHLKVSSLADPGICFCAPRAKVGENDRNRLFGSPMLDARSKNRSGSVSETTRGARRQRCARKHSRSLALPTPASFEFIRRPV